MFGVLRQFRGLVRSARQERSGRHLGASTTTRFIVCLAVVIVGMTNVASAVTVRLNAIRTGAYSSNGYQERYSYVTGITDSFGPESRGFVVFDLTGLQPATVLSATLTLQNPYSDNEYSPDDLEVRLYGMPNLNSVNMGPTAVYSGYNLTNFNYIGSTLTPHYSTAWVPLHGSGLPSTIPVSFSLASNALADLEAGLGTDSFFAFGMKLIKADVQEPKPEQYAFLGTASGGVVYLDLELSSVPEPQSVGLLWTVVGLAMGTRRKRRA